MLTTYLSCSGCRLLSDRSPAMRYIARNKFDLSVCGRCIRRHAEEEGARLVATWRQPKMGQISEAHCA